MRKRFTPDFSSRIRQKRVQIHHKGGIGNILQMIPLIKWCLQELPGYEIWLNLSADYPATAELFSNWSKRLGGIINLGTARHSICFDLRPVRVLCPFTGKYHSRIDSLEIGESQAYLRAATEDECESLNCLAPLHSEISFTETERINRIEKPYIVIWPGCKITWPIKAYPHFKKLIEMLSEEITVALVGQSKELFIDRIPKRAISFIDVLTLGEVASLIKDAECFIGNDGGLMHLAATTGTPTYALFGPTSIIKNKPRANNVTVIKAEGFNCMPCQGHETFSQKECKLGLNCMEEIAPIRIFDQILREIILKDSF